MIDCTTGKEDFRGSNPPSELLPPCSTFKIWNTLIGLECGILTSPDQPFYRWDSVIRGIPDWNHDLTLREAFQASCVPAFQELARRIGEERMKGWLDRISYGNHDISAGIDVFWLPEEGRRTILISPEKQSRMICSLVSGKLPFSEKSTATLKEIMLQKKTGRGTLYGKTGSGANDKGEYALGWFVGYVESGGRTFAFACAYSGILF